MDDYRLSYLTSCGTRQSSHLPTKGSLSRSTSLSSEVLFSEIIAKICKISFARVTTEPIFHFSDP